MCDQTMIIPTLNPNNHLWDQNSALVRKTGGGKKGIRVVAGHALRDDYEIYQNKANLTK